MNQKLTFSLLREVSNGDQVFMRRLIYSFVQQLNQDLPSLKRAFEAEEKDFLAKTCHQLKSSLNYMDMKKERDLCVFLENALRSGDFPSEELQKFIYGLELGQKRLLKILDQDSI
jgi:HPt (histidine-containing phosphotransfer) domain-containing protein